MTEPFVPLVFSPDQLNPDMSFDTTINMLNEAFAYLRNRYAEHATICKNDITISYKNDATQFNRVKEHKEAIVKYYRDLGWLTVRIFEERHFNSYNVIFIELKR